MIAQSPISVLQGNIKHFCQHQNWSQTSRVGARTEYSPFHPSCCPRCPIPTPLPLKKPSKTICKTSLSPPSPSNLQILIFFHTLVQTASDDDLNAKYQRCYCAAGAGQCKRQMGQGSLGTGMCSPAAPQGRLLAQKVQRTLPAHPQVKTH